MIKKILQRWWGILAIVFLCLVFSLPYIVRGSVPFPSTFLVSFFPPWSAQYSMPVKNGAMPDVITQIYPWKHLTIQTWKLGQVPLWNPYSFAGSMHAANYQTAVFSPLNLLFFVLPQIDAWSVMILLQPFLAGIFMYWALRGFVRSKGASLLGAVAFMFCGFIVAWMAYGTLGYAALWLPLIVGAIHRQMQKSSWKTGALVSVGFWLSLVSGHFQVSVYVLLFSFCFLTYKTIRTKNIARGGGLLGFMVIGILLAMPQLLISFDAYTKSVRSTSFAKGEIIPWQYLITFIAPDFYGNPVTRNDWFGHYAEWAGYIGVIPLMLAGIAVWVRKKNDEWFFLAAGVVALLFALPTPLTDMLYALHIPVLSTSAASRIIILVSFSLCVLAARGFDALTADVSLKRRSVLFYSLAAALFLIAAWVVLMFFPVLPPEKLAIAKRNFVLPTIFGFIGLALMAVSLWKKRWAMGLVIAGCIAVSAFDLYRFAAKWMPFEPRNFVYPQTPLLKDLTARVGTDRVFGNFGNEMVTYFGLPAIEGYDALYQGRYGTLISSADTGAIKSSGRSVVLLGKASTYGEAILRLLGVRYMIARHSDGRNVWVYPFWKYPNYTSVYKDDSYEVLENTNALPRTFLTASYRLLKNDQDMINALYDSSFDPTREVVLEHAPDRAPEAGTGSARIVRYTPNEVTIQTKADGVKLLFLSDVFDEGWKASVDGKEVRVYRANYDFRAVTVPSGNHTVRFFYRPKPFIIGVWLAVVACGILLAGFVKERLYENRHI